MTLSIAKMQRAYRQCHIYNTSERAENLNCKRVRQAWLISRQRDFKSWTDRLVDLRLKFLWGVLLYHKLHGKDSNHDRMFLVQPCYLTTNYSPLYLFLGQWSTVGLIFP